MHFTKIVTSILLAAAASASPLGSRNFTLGKREDSDGQAGAYINAGTDVAFAFVYGSKFFLTLPARVTIIHRVPGQFIRSRMPIFAHN
jgi:hypothetical protein